MNKQDIKEKIIFLSITFGIFLPVRFVFYTYVSDWWVGSLGVIGGLMILLLYLVKKGKLGYFGRIWKKQIIKISKGKLGKVGMVVSLIMILMFSSIVWVTDLSYDTDGTSELLGVLDEKGVSDLGSLANVGSLTDYTDLLLFETWIEIYHTLSENPEFIGQMYAVIDKFSFGLHQHFNIVLLVEEIEMLCFLIYFRYFYKLRESTLGV